jgi:hypothetical protein
MRLRMRGLTAVIILQGTLVAATTVGAQREPRDRPETSGPLSVSALTEALRAEQAQGYSITAASNGARLMAGLLLRLARAAHARDSLAPPFVVTADAYESAFLAVTGLSRDALPLSVRMGTEYHEDVVVEHRQSQVIEAVLEGPRPVFAIRVECGWTDATRPRYSYVDRTGSPVLRVTHDRHSGYTIVDYGDMVMHDEIRGISGRAMSGLLGVLFDVIGDARATEARFAVASDGTQVALGSGRKGPFSITQTVTVHPNGNADKGVMPGRPDLCALAALLNRPAKLRYAAPLIDYFGGGQ